ncbi:hypothetical protein PEp14_00019 [Erwinia phage PEp14]|uniref:Calx-beta domain-containing protein n=1 Tax=Erwinia phage PEp14 TaxID=1131315 RepID=H2DE49_9CAUD|nr:tail protein [Erwinia phage PEp14]AEY69608.1 hypothetical protein PEp14_00019 [Erwinia phage PEp14]
MARNAIFTVTLSEPSDKLVTVDYRTVDFTAKAPEDYTALSGRLIFEPGEVSKTVSVPVLDNEPGEPAERFILTLFNPQNADVARLDGYCDIPAGGHGERGNGPLIMAGLITNSWHNEMGRGGYFHAYSGTSEGQSIGIEGSLLASRVLTGGTSAEATAATWYRQNGLNMLDALGNGSLTGPMLRQPVPSDPKTITLLHWLFAARGDIPSQGINYTAKAVPSGGKLTLPAKDAFKVWMIYPATSYLLYSSPFSPTFDSAAPGGDTSIRLTEADYKVAGDTIEVTLPAGAPANVAMWNVVYGYQNAGTIKQGEAEEAYPVWTPIEPGYSACAPDTFRWFEYAMTLAANLDTRDGASTKWTRLRAAMRRTAVRGQSISDLREVIKPMPQFDAIPVTGEPSGMFCWSNHPDAKAPSAELIAKGASSEWLGYNFWSRVGGSGGSVRPGEFVWTPDLIGKSVIAGDVFNGALKASVPAAAAVSQVQIGRGFNDEWRQKTAYQEADHFLFVAVSMNKRPNLAAGEHCYVYLSSTKFYSKDTRWYCDIGQLPELKVDGSLSYLLIPRTSFKRKDGDNTELPAGTRFESFGISIEMKAAYELKLVALRPIGGASADAVKADVAKAVAGSVMPFFPGAMPFAINADTVKQQFVGWNGSPFHGYQLPDFWYFLAEDAAAVHPGITPSQLPVALSDGSLSYPIRPATASGATKTPAALLCEQQMLFLAAASDKWVKDGGTRGGYAHTFVLNTPARMSLGNPTPHSWVYTNDDPNTRWAGYLMRVIESCAKLAYLSRNLSAFEDAGGMAFNQAFDGVSFINQLWPDLNGQRVTIGGKATMIYGFPTDFDDPRKGPPQRLYEEPHSAALLLRACLWLNLSGKLSPAQSLIVAAVGKRCWDYMELRYRRDEGDSMRFTWANFDGANSEQWYGFWHFEIVATMAYLLQNPTGIPDGVDAATMRARLVETQSWLQKNVR